MAALKGQVQVIIYMIKHKNMNSRCTHFLLAEHVMISQSSTTQAQTAMPCWRRKKDPVSCTEVHQQNWGETCGTSTLAQALYFRWLVLLHYFCKEYIKQILHTKSVYHKIKVFLRL